MQIPTKDIAFLVYINTRYHLSKSKQTKEACVISYSEISKTITLAEIW